LAGKLVTSKKTFDVSDKYNGTKIDSLPSFGLKEVELAVDAAAVALHEMKKLTALERQDIILQAADDLLKMKHKLSQLLVAETGTIANDANLEVERCSKILRLYATEIPHLHGESLSLDADLRGKNKQGYWIRVPAGVVSAITGFNTPIVLLAHKLAPALAAGNTLVVKPSSLAPLACVELCSIFATYLPPGSLNVVTGAGEILGPALVKNPQVNIVSFTGRRETGAEIASMAGVKRLIMELGSNCPNIVCSDADMDFTIQNLIDAAYSYQGQNCLHAQRILVQEDVYDDFKRRFVDKASKLRLGDPRLASTEIGPMISEASSKRVEEWVNEAIRLGAKVLLGGTRSGVFYMPTLLEGVAAKAKVMLEEIFGPVSCLMKFSSIQEAVEIANKTQYGLEAAIFTHRLDNTQYVINNLQFGGIKINESTDVRLDIMPFGGFKASGLGREGLKHAIEEMTEVKMILYNLSNLNPK
jgi:acyl-CoA reductase-like NAD-dependent aldehyde dehydrogenase